jgi:hypothetical protein
MPAPRSRMTTATLPKPSTAAPRVRHPARADHAALVGIAVGIGAVVTVGLWFRHGGIGAANGPGAFATAVGQLTALVGTYGIVVQILLMSRISTTSRSGTAGWAS